MTCLLSKYPVKYVKKILQKLQKFIIYCRQLLPNAWQYRKPATGSSLRTHGDKKGLHKLCADLSVVLFSINKIQELRKTPDMMVTVRAEDLACLMWKAHDTTKALTDFLDKTEFVQEEFNKKPEERDDCFPKLSDVWSLHRGDILRQWIDNLKRSLRNVI